MKTATWIQTCDPTTVEVIGAEGFDYCILDMEHSALNWQNIVGLMRGIPIGSQMQPLIRVKSSECLQIRQSLDLGAAGVIVPMVDTPKEAEDIVRYASFPQLDKEALVIAA